MVLFMFILWVSALIFDVYNGMHIDSSSLGRKIRKSFWNHGCPVMVNSVPTRSLVMAESHVSAFVSERYLQSFYYSHWD